ncbi:MAG: hypothetical protein KDI28_06575 [Pseudomonadales bacterium]|nr:hypothetical protein [Pseudomonadales bacterium]MCP5358572.1 hypothetical protein [Pseudomonadales bacterium]
MIARYITLIAVLSSPALWAESSGSDNFSTACATVEFMAKMVAVNLLVPANNDNMAELEGMQQELKELNRRVCQSVLLTRDTRYESHYSNGTRISRDLYDSPWYFPGGHLFLASPGEDTTIYYPNGQVMSYHWTHGGEAVFWPNGQVATFRLRHSYETWYYPGGQIITYQAGVRGGRWFYPFARLDGRIGQEVISSNWGDEDEDFNFLNFDTSGRPYMTRERIRRKLSLTDDDLLDVAGVMLLITRLYQAEDDARQFVPADANITGPAW